MIDTSKSRRRWTEEETILALYLYFQLPFGKLHSGTPEIQRLAEAIDRTSSSVAMKLSNFASLDPKITGSGRKGLVGASALDRETYAKFQKNWNGLVTQAAELWERELPKLPETPQIKGENLLSDDRMAFNFSPYEGDGERQAFVNQRLGQSFFRRAVLANFEEKCCITGIAERRLLVASHIRPWRIDTKNRHNPANGFLLSATMDRAFDCGLITIDTESRVCVSQQLLANPPSETRAYFSQYNNAHIRQATRFRPDTSFIEWHMREIFVG